MIIFMGEAFSTFLLLFLGLGLTQFDRKPNQLKIAMYWVAGVFFGNLVGNLFSSSNMNPIFLFNQFYGEEHFFRALSFGIAGEIIGATTAIVLLLKIPSRKKRTLESYAAVASVPNPLIACSIEILGTFSLLLVSKLISGVSMDVLRFLIISLYIGSLVLFIGPITGASFNPIRDFVPRFVFSTFRKDWQDFLKSLLSSTIAPCLGGLLFIIFL